jgi:hypothetical protein
MTMLLCQAFASVQGPVRGRAIDAMGRYGSYGFHRCGDRILVVGSPYPSRLARARNTDRTAKLRDDAKNLSAGKGQL